MPRGRAACERWVTGAEATCFLGGRCVSGAARGPEPPQRARAGHGGCCTSNGPRSGEPRDGDRARQPREVAPGREFSALQSAFLPSCFSGLCGNVALLRGKRLSDPQESRESSHRRRRLQAPRAHLFRTSFDFSPWCWASLSRELGLTCEWGPAAARARSGDQGALAGDAPRPPTEQGNARVCGLTAPEDRVGCT